MRNIVFNDEFEDEQGLCSICGADTNLTGWNEKKNLTRFECSECGAIFICDKDYNETILKGKKRDWEKYLKENLTFPFDAVIEEYQNENIFAKERGPIKKGYKVTVNKVVGEDDLYGVIVSIKINNKAFQFPLCDLEAVDKESSNFKIIDKYGVWFANCQ